MLRIHFTRDDLSRTYVAEGAAPLWEVVFSLHKLPPRSEGAPFRDWRRDVRTRLRERGVADMVRNGLAPLAPDGNYFPDFITPTSGLLDLKEGIEAVVATPPATVRHELTRMDQTSDTPPWAWELAGSSVKPRRWLGDMMSTYHEVALGPHWDHISERIAMDRARRAQALRHGGIEGLFRSFAPAMRWRPPVLEVRKRFVDRDMHLRGRGLVLVASYFCWQAPVPFADVELPPTLVYPIARDLLEPRPTLASNALARLLGTTRAAILENTVGSPTTTRLARQLGVSPATVSEHTAVLRESGLITTDRHGNTVLHTITALGNALLDASRRDVAMWPE